MLATFTQQMLFIHRNFLGKNKLTKILGVNEINIILSNTDRSAFWLTLRKLKKSEAKGKNIDLILNFFCTVKQRLSMRESQ